MNIETRYKGHIIRRIHPLVGPHFYWIIDPAFDSEWIGTANTIAEAKLIISELIAAEMENEDDPQ